MLDIVIMCHRFLLIIWSVSAKCDINYVHKKIDAASENETM